jgi:hypothetical protein
LKRNSGMNFICRKRAGDTATDKFRMLVQRLDHRIGILGAEWRNENGGDP